jgi:hypothetical protein
VSSVAVWGENDRKSLMQTSLGIYEAGKRNPSQFLIKERIYRRVVWKKQGKIFFKKERFFSPLPFPISHIQP